MSSASDFSVPVPPNPQFIRRSAGASDTRWLCETCSVKQHIPSFSNEAASQSSSLWCPPFCVVCVCAFHSSYFYLNCSCRNKQETGGKRYCQDVLLQRVKSVQSNRLNKTRTGLLHARAEILNFAFSRESKTRTL